MADVGAGAGAGHTSVGSCNGFFVIPTRALALVRTNAIRRANSPPTTFRANLGNGIECPCAQGQAERVVLSNIYWSMLVRVLVRWLHMCPNLAHQLARCGGAKSRLVPKRALKRDAPMHDCVQKLLGVQSDRFGIDDEVSIHDSQLWPGNHCGVELAHSLSKSCLKGAAGAQRTT